MQRQTTVTGILCCALFCVPVLAQPKKLSAADKRFMTMAAEADMTEAHLGQMAQDQAANTTVKSFGQKLAQDHKAAYEELTELAEKTGEAIPKGIDIRRDKAIEQLTRLKGKAFDQRFVRDEIRDHEKAIAAFKYEAAHGSDAGVKAYASKTLPTLEDHLHRAEELAKPAKHA